MHRLAHDPAVGRDGHRQHAIIEQVTADLKSGALAYLASGKFTANAAWLVLAAIEFNLTHATGTLPRHFTTERQSADG